MIKSTRRPVKDDLIRLRVTKDQKAKIEEAAHRRGLSVSAWVLFLILRETEEA